MDYSVFEIHADFCRAIADPKRLMIITLLDNMEMTVNEMVQSMDITLSNISQNLRILRAHNIVRTRKMGQHVFYGLVDKRLPEACRQIRSILLDGIVNKDRMIKKMR